MKKSTPLSSSIPRIGLGCMGMSEFYGPSDDEASEKLLLRAYELGYRHFDTADMYGQGANERLIGRFLKLIPKAERDTITVATKCGIRRSPENPREVSIDSSPAYIRQATEQSLIRLGVECLDLLYLHRKSPSIPTEDSVGELNLLKQEGKIANIGLSEVAANTLRVALKVAPIACIQSEYSLWTRDPEESILPICEQHGVRFVAYSPLGRGFFSGALAEKWNQTADLRPLLPRFQGKNLDQNLQVRLELEEFAKAHQLSTAELALSWVLRNPIVTAIPGSRRETHLAMNLAARDRVLSGEVLQELDKIFAPDKIVGNRYPEQLMATVNV